MQRRTVLQSCLAVAGALAAPLIGHSDALRILRTIPEADLAVVDPVWTTANVTRNHAFMVFDMLHGMDEAFNTHSGPWCCARVCAFTTANRC